MSESKEESATMSKARKVTVWILGVAIVFGLVGMVALATQKTPQPSIR